LSADKLTKLKTWVADKAWCDINFLVTNVQLPKLKLAFIRQTKRDPNFVILFPMLVLRLSFRKHSKDHNLCAVFKFRKFRLF